MSFVHILHLGIGHYSNACCASHAQPQLVPDMVVQVKGFKAGGVDQETAQKILARWEEVRSCWTTFNCLGMCIAPRSCYQAQYMQTGATSPDGLRRMLLGRSLGTAGVVALQLLLDAGASYGSFNTAR